MTSSLFYTASCLAPGSSTPEGFGRFVPFVSLGSSDRDAAAFRWRVSHRSPRVNDEKPVRLMGLEGAV